jgi:hypothetical protein
MIGDRRPAEGSREEPEHLVSWRQARHPRAGLQHDASPLGTEHGIARVHPERDQRVAEVNASRTDRDPHLPVPQCGRALLAGDKPETVQHAARRHVKPGSRNRRDVRVNPGEPGHVGTVVPQGDLRFAGRQRGGQRSARGLLVAFITADHIHQHQAARIFCLGRPGQSPDSSGPEVRHILAGTDGHRSAGQHYQCRVGRTFPGQPLSKQLKGMLDRRLAHVIGSS